jgi:hypothetical protein
MYDFGLVPSGITSAPNFLHIRPAVLEMNHADTPTHVRDKTFLS